ncbi:MAG TPA: ABC transporter permease [Nevskiaceae bacterium]|nr:ABC transporter permease [Nevskiaceae bacterium]
MKRTATAIGTGWWTVFVKEVRENLRDKRVLVAALLYGPLLGPVLFAAMMGFILGKQQEESTKPLELPVMGVEHAPGFVDWLRRQGVVVEPPLDDAEAAIREQREDVVLRISADYGSAWSQGQPARVDLLFDSSRLPAQTKVSRVEALVQGYASTTASLRLRVRGVDPSLLNAVQLVRQDQSTPQSRGAMLLAMLPYFLVLSAFVGGMYLAIDTTAGERERASLEPLLITPVSRARIMSGKLLATALFALASLVICVIAFVVSMRFIPVAELGLSVDLGAATLAQLLLVVAPIALLASSAQTVVASFAKSFREAQTYLQFLLLIPAIPSILFAINPTRPEPWMEIAPLFSQAVHINQLLRGDPVGLATLLLAALVTTALATLLAGVAVRLYQREQLALGG